MNGKPFELSGFAWDVAPAASVPPARRPSGESAATGRHAVARAAPQRPQFRGVSEPRRRQHVLLRSGRDALRAPARLPDRGVLPVEAALGPRESGPIRWGAAPSQPRRDIAARHCTHCACPGVGAGQGHPPCVPPERAHDPSQSAIRRRKRHHGTSPAIEGLHNGRVVSATPSPLRGLMRPLVQKTSRAGGARCAYTRLPGRVRAAPNAPIVTQQASALGPTRRRKRTA